MKNVHRLMAEMLFIFHVGLLLINILGWLVPSIWNLYIFCLAVTLLFELVYGYCILSKWEFDLRKKNKPNLDYDYYWTSFYTHKLTQGRISEAFFKRYTRVFLISSLLINIFFYYLAAI